MQHDRFAAVALHGGVRGRADVPDDVQRVFPTAHEIDVAAHVATQAAFQRHVHAAVSKTINLRQGATAVMLNGEVVPSQETALRSSVPRT